MNNQNVADISAFENLQADQHDRTGVSQMSVFNAVSAADVNKMIQKLKIAGQKAIKARREAYKVVEEARKLEKQAKTDEEAALFTHVYDNAMNETREYASASDSSWFR
jgi:biotin operon repressor